jgi:hypothetical protein
MTSLSMNRVSIFSAALLALQVTVGVGGWQPAAGPAVTVFLENDETFQVNHATLQRRTNPGSVPLIFEPDDVIVFARRQPAAGPDRRVAFSELAMVDYYSSTSVPCIPLLTLTDGSRIVIGTLRRDQWPADLSGADISAPELDGYEVKQEYQVGGDSSDGVFRNSLLGCPREARGDEFLRILRIAFTASGAP